ncbi:hypothetical protein [uncultured Clostridium sp.]|uniref:hypothetical protein n=1 Tax=uncultured Clostridium sp. TaxID=59620 RepID=UPI00321621A7
MKKRNFLYRLRPSSYWKDKSYALQRVSLIIVAIFTIYFISQIIALSNHSFKDETYDLPIVTLYDIEGSKDLLRTGSILYTTVNDANYYNYNFNIFATTYNTAESVDMDGTNIYMHTSTYKVTLPYMVDNLV